jgi:hypothetical protein
MVDIRTKVSTSVGRLLEHGWIVGECTAENSPAVLQMSVARWDSSNCVTSWKISLVLKPMIALPLRAQPMSQAV